MRYLSLRLPVRFTTIAGLTIASLAGLAVVSPITGCAGQGGAQVAGTAGSGSPGAGGSNPTGNGGSNPTGNGGSNPTGGGPALIQIKTDLPAASACKSDSPGPRAWRRLSAIEMTATIHDLFKDQAAEAPVSTVFSDQPNLGFTVDASALVVKDLDGQALMNNAETIAHWAVTTKLSTISTCTTTDATCRKQFITSFGKRAFRAPLSDARVAAYEKLFMAESSFADGAEAVIGAMLQSPYFLYRSELGPTSASPGSSVTLTPHEVATSLAYLLTGSMPDDTLLAAADTAASNGTALPIDAQLTRLLADPRVPDSVMRFAGGWLGLDRLTNTLKEAAYATLTDQTKADMEGETRAFILDTFSTGGTLSTLLTANYSFLNRNMAMYYGLPVGSLGTTYTKTTIPSSARDAGILAHGGLLAGYAGARTSSPTQRGKLVRTRMLCQSLPPPPSNVNTMLDPPAPNQTTRQLYEKHVQYDSTDPERSCATCHTYIDYIGFGFENYDVVGRYRTTDAGQSVDASGKVVRPPSGAEFTFTGIAPLATYLASSEDVKSCLVRYWSYYAYGTPGWTQDACTYNAIKQEAAASNYSLKSVLTGIVHAPRFTKRVGDP
jgi:hypothetical protein